MLFSPAGLVNPLDVAIATAREAGALLLAHHARPLRTRQKGARGDLVTAADHASEALIVARLAAATPHATILAEEGGGQTGSGDERWIVDPLDGTTNYAHGYPLYCVSIAYERGGELVAGAIYAPALDELYAAEQNGAATCNGQRIVVSQTSTLSDALVCTGFTPARYDRNGKHFARLSGLAQGVRRDGSAALDLAFVARGVFDAFWEMDLHAWDIAAGTLIVRQAGGVVSAARDEAFALEGGSVLASNGKLHTPMCAALRGKVDDMTQDPRTPEDHQHSHEHLDGTQHVHEHDHHDHDHDHEHHEHGSGVHSHAYDHEQDDEPDGKRV